MSLQPIEALSPVAAISEEPLPLCVLILTADLPPANWSGIAIAVESEARALAALGHDVTVITSGETALPQWEGVTVRHLPRDHFPQDLPSFDRIHLHSLALAELAIEAARRWSIPLLYTAHMLLVSEHSAPPANPISSLTGSPAAHWIGLQQTLFDTANHVRFLSLSELDRASELYPALKGRSSAVAHGLEPSATPPIPAAERDRLLVYSGRFCRNKGTDIAAHAFERALTRLPGWTALIAGGHGQADFMGLVENVAGRCRGRIRTPGWLPYAELQTSVAHAALVVVPSRYEPFGLAALEALRLGTPVIACDTGGLGEILRPDRGVLLPPVTDPAVWAEVIVALAADMPLRERLTAAGPEAIQTHFNAQTQAQALLQLIPPPGRFQAP